MIQSDEELKVAQERVSYLLNLLAQLSVSSRPEELALVSGGYRAEVERMPAQDYRLPHAIGKSERKGWLTRSGRRSWARLHIPAAMVRMPPAALIRSFLQKGRLP